MAGTITSGDRPMTAETAADNNGDGGDFRNVQGGCEAAVQKRIKKGLE